ncbi:DNA-binding transcriptional regulator, XRE-family HTH domain [Arcanobacterium phocae]|uniref:DNA-binding transcriptional regulator, XRE-family HTH domain n=1 Tax=Arcanobacterium phocae TaxID=131112 RepID=A0A1H2LB69_9ACTO|nr:helix-turn-helix transcriptional regulator [Arcanobacterium phocae]SDU78290.1 DNA-binding transcriptional regulator, XRE-family HTH domain [Arcanobacterium phocae]
MNIKSKLVAERIQQHRLAAELNQTELAHLTQISQPTLSRIEQATQSLTAELALKIAIALNISIEAILGPALISDSLATAARPGSSTSAMTTMHEAAASYFADFRRVTL